MLEPLNVRKNEPLAQYTTFGVGGTAEQYVAVRSRDQFLAALRWAKENGVPFWILAGGSNVVCTNGEVRGLCIHVTGGEIAENGESLTVDAGVPLMDFITFAMSRGLAGVEKMSGIPGTLGGAVVGNAGAYGQTISDRLVRVEIAENGETRWLTKEECGFSYRDSQFKMHPWSALRAEFSLTPGNSVELQTVSFETIALRSQKYPPGIKCPGSFFKNIFLDTVPAETRAHIPANRDFYGKVPAWYFLNEVGARGMVHGGLRIADIHGNLIVNEGTATYDDVVSLARDLKQRVKEKFGVELEEEVRYVA